MEIVVVSDTHGRNDVLQQIRLQHPKAYAYIHCGDSEADIHQLDGFASVIGNNDTCRDYPYELVLDLNGMRTLVMHGHQFSRSKMSESLINRAKAKECQLVLFGHTHAYSYEVIDGISIINPGSLFHNRDGSLPSYALIQIEHNKINVKRIYYPYVSRK
jgi:putative phosphoesterase